MRIPGPIIEFMFGFVHCGKTFRSRHMLETQVFVNEERLEGARQFTLIRFPSAGFVGLFHAKPVHNCIRVDSTCNCSQLAKSS